MNTLGHCLLSSRDYPLCPVMEEAPDPSVSFSLESIMVQLVEKAAMLYFVEGLAKVHDKEVCLLPAACEIKH